MVGLFRLAHCKLVKDMILLYKYIGEELNIDERKIVLGLTEVLGEIKEKCVKIIPNTGFQLPFMVLSCRDNA